ncbi:CARDB domain-containing protein [Halarchaeum acidiphilum]|nr:CARDB domain-containing protein [Halarchaeum acidiphilum]
MKVGGRLGTLLVTALVITAALGAVAPAASAASSSSGGSSGSSSDNTSAYVTVGNVTVNPDNPVTNERTTITATLQNAESGSESVQITQVSLQGGSTYVAADDVGTLGPGASVQVPFSTSFDSAGWKHLTVVLRGIQESGSVVVIKKPVYVKVDEATVDPGVTAKATVENGSSVLEATLAEHGTVDLEDAQLDAVVDGETVATKSLADVDGQSERTVTFDGTDIPAGNVTLVARYTAQDEDGSASTSLRYTPQDTGKMDVTGLEVSGGAGSYTINGDASNLGSADAESVVVSVVDSSSISQTESYYVGEVETSEFATFEVSADVTSDVDSIPVRLSYAANGEQHSQIVNVDVSDTNAGTAFGSASASGSASGRSGPPGGAGGGLPTTKIAIVVGVIVLLAAAVLVHRWRNP